MYNVPERNIWQKMKGRVLNPKDAAYKDYGGRGVAICDSWRKSFLAFYADMGARPGPEYSINRIDNDGPYSPQNCEWATIDTQLNNYRRNRFITYDGRTQSLKRWVDEQELPYGRVHRRIQMGWPELEALELVRRT